MRLPIKDRPVRTLIIGGGLSGLALAELLTAKCHDYALIEARNRLGAMIKRPLASRRAAQSCNPISLLGAGLRVSNRRN